MGKALTCDEFRVYAESPLQRPGARMERAGYQHFLNCPACRRWMLDMAATPPEAVAGIEAQVAFRQAHTAQERN